MITSPGNGAVFGGVRFGCEVVFGRVNLYGIEDVSVKICASGIQHVEGGDGVTAC